jgi:hypothetical protein
MVRLLIIAVLLSSGLLLLSINFGTSDNLVFSASFPVPRSTATPEKTKCVPCLRPDGNKANTPPNVTEVTLDKNELRIPCSETPTHTELREMVVSVKTDSEDADGDILTYNYTVSGGRIIGTGKNVIWDLSRSAAGTYEIIAGVDDGCGVCGRTVKKTVSVRECVASPD